MVALTTQQRKEIRDQYMRERHTSGTCTKADLLAAFNGLDDYLEANATAINNAIPQPARAQLTTAQKALIMAMVAMKRYGG